MTQFGTPTRTATQDANEGIVYPPKAKRIPTAVTPVQLRPTTDSVGQGVKSFGQAFGAIAHQLVEEDTQNVKEQLELDAYNRQGEEAAINDIDQSKKRGDWTKFIFGESPSYRAAQQRAVANGVQKMYIEQATTIDNHAGTSPDSYKRMLKDQLDVLLEPYEDDDETKALVTQAWGEASKKLVNSQHKSHYAYSQQQERQETGHAIDTLVDTWKVDLDVAISDEEFDRIEQQQKSFFAGGMKPPQMTKEAWRSLVNERLNSSLRQGNYAFFSAAEANGWVDKLLPAERLQFDEAMSVYDTKFISSVNELFANAEIGALEAKDLEAAKQVYFDLEHEINALAQRSSGSERASLALTRGHRDAALKRKAIDDIGRKAIKEAQKKAAEADRFALAKEAEKSPAERRAGMYSEYSFTRSELEQAANANVIDEVADALKTDTEEVTTQEAVGVIINNPALAKHIARKRSKSQVKAPIIKNIAESFIYGWSDKLDEFDRPTPELATNLQSISAFAEDPKFREIIGEDNFKRYQLLNKGVLAKNTGAMIQRNIDNYFANVGKFDDWKVRWPVNEDVTHRKLLLQKLDQWGVKNPNEATVSRYMEELKEGTIINEGVTDDAWDYVRSAVKMRDSIINGRTLTGVKYLDEYTGEWTLEEVLNGAGKPEVNMMAGFIHNLGIAPKEDGTLVASLDELENTTNYRLYTMPGVEGIILDAPQAIAPVRISPQQLQDIASVMSEQRKYEDALRADESEVMLEAFKEEQEMTRFLPTF